jgi:hypothetical protein
MAVALLRLDLPARAGRQSFAGERAYNAEQAEHGGEWPSWLDSVLSPDSAAT